MASLRRRDLRLGAGPEGIEIQVVWEGKMSLSRFRRIESPHEDRDPFRPHCRRTWSHGISAAVILVAVAAAGFRLEAQDEPKSRPKPQDELTETPVAESAPAKGPLNFHGHVTDRLTGKPLVAASVRIKPSV